MRQRNGNQQSAKTQETIMRQRKIRKRRYSDSNRPHLKFVVNYRESGKRKRSFFETKEAANSFVAFKNAELKRNGVEGAEFPTWLRVMAQRCTDKLEAFGKTIEDATEHFIAHLKAIERSCTVDALVDEVIAKKAKECGKRQRPASKDYIDDLKIRLGRFAKTFGSRTVAAITPMEIEDWLSGLKDNRTDADLSPLSRGNYARAIGVAFSFAVRRKYAPGNPTSEINKPAAAAGDIGILGVADMTRLLAATPKTLRAYVAIGAFAGLRSAELQRLDWSDVHFDEGLIEITAQNAKTARRRMVTIQPNLREWLLPVRKHTGKVTPDDLRKQFEQAREAAGILQWPNNALRHSFASYHLAHFKDAAALALQMGHTNSGMIFEHYRQLVKPKDAERYWNIKPAAVSKVVPMVA
jgi:integrase